MLDTAVSGWIGYDSFVGCIRSADAGYSWLLCGKWKEVEVHLRRKAFGKMRRRDPAGERNETVFVIF